MWGYIKKEGKKMKEKSINLQKTESFLRETIPEALATLGDNNLKSLAVVDVDCKRGKYDAIVYLDPAMLNYEDKEYILKHLKIASSVIKNYISDVSGWYRVPKMKFVFDNSLEKRVKLDSLFDKISKELHGDKK